MSTIQAWNLVADIGGTNARFGLTTTSGDLKFFKTYSVAQYLQFIDALNAFKKDVQHTNAWNSTPTAACFAVACPVDVENIRFTNSPWQFTREQISQALDKPRLVLINDFAAVGYAITDLNEKGWKQLSGTEPAPNSPIAFLGAGTGLGVGALVPTPNGVHVIEGEGGHVDFAPNDPQEAAVLKVLSQQFGHVSAERLLSGSGIENIYKALAKLQNIEAKHTNAADISHAALNSTDTLAIDTLALFCRALGSVAGNLALTLGAKGGVYIAGGIVPRILDFVESSEFKARFLAKGRFNTYLQDIPVRAVTKDQLGLIGASKRLNIPE